MSLFPSPGQTTGSATTFGAKLSLAKLRSSKNLEVVWRLRRVVDGNQKSEGWLGQPQGMFNSLGMSGKKLIHPCLGGTLKLESTSKNP